MPHNRIWNQEAYRRQTKAPPAEAAGSTTFVERKAAAPRESWWTTADRQGFTAKAWNRRKGETRENLLPQARKRF